MNDALNCYNCIYRRNIPGDAHSMCVHPETGMDKTEYPEFEGLLGMLGLGVSKDAARKLNIAADAHGVSHGWFMWPGNFDPVWLRSCSGFAAASESIESQRAV